MEVKICGVTRVEDALMAAEAGADYVGVVAAESPRRVSPETARRIVEALPGGTSAVLVAREADAGRIAELARVSGAGIVQLHGNGDARSAAEAAARVPGLRFVRAWEVADGVSAAEIRAAAAEFAARGVPLLRIILDAPKGGGAADRSRFAGIAREITPLGIPVWRAGGLREKQIESVRAEGCYAGLDVAGGVESSPGVKDADLVRRFIAAAKGTPGGR